MAVIMLFFSSQHPIFPNQWITLEKVQWRYWHFCCFCVQDWEKYSGNIYLFIYFCFFVFWGWW